MEPKKPSFGKTWTDHYLNAYNPLVDALQAAVEVADCHPQFEKYSTRWRQLLEQLGEDVPPRVG